MVFDLDLRKLLRRYSPTWFRWPANQSFAYALSRWVAYLHTQLLGARQEVAYQYRVNGLTHSMAERMNDIFDPVLRRITITVPSQLPVLYCLDDAEAPVAYLGDDGELSGYYCLEDAELNVAVQYAYEFLVEVPASLSFSSDSMFTELDLYRFAGRRPAIRRFDDLNNTVAMIYYHG